MMVKKSNNFLVQSFKNATDGNISFSDAISVMGSISILNTMIYTGMLLFMFGLTEVLQIIAESPFLYIVLWFSIVVYTVFFMILRLGLTYLYLFLMGSGMSAKYKLIMPVDFFLAWTLQLFLFLIMYAV